jgi:hypothetical protein
MQTKSKLMLVVLAALAIGASSAFAVTGQVARGGDDLTPPPMCPDNNGVDTYCGGLLAKDGADDVLPEGVDDNGVDFIIAKDGADDLPGDDNGVDFILAKDGADDLPGDDHGVDPLAG